MAESKFYLAIDIGASSGRHILGWLENGKIRLEELYRFENKLVKKNGHLCWDLEHLFQEVVAGLKKCRELERIPASIGIDTWGVDFVLLTGGIQTIGNYPGRARNPEELMADIDEVISLVPGKPKMNLHASYAIFDKGEWVDRDKLEPKHFAKWVEFCKERGLGCDFNPTFFSHPKCDPLTLSSANEETRKFWIDHGKASIRISSYLAKELGQPCVMNIWTGDGLKDIPGDRLGPRKRYRESIDAILSEPFDFKEVKPCVESKVFGIGVESYTVGSAEFALSYAAMNKDKGNLTKLMVVPWMVPGGKAIADASTKLMEKYRVVVWAHHGLFVCGDDFDEAFGLMDTVEKASEICVKVRSMGGKKQTITKENFLDLARDFNIDLNKAFLD